MPIEKILVIEDEPSLADVLAYNLKKEGYEPIIEHNGKDGLRIAGMQLPSLIILDLMLPGLGGLEVCRELRTSAKTARIPILMLTAKSEESDQLVGFAMGADDYVGKPFSVKVLMQRIKVLLRRATEPPPSEEIIESGDIRIDKRSHRVIYKKAVLAVTPTEFRILETLIQQPGRAFTRHDLMESAMNDSIVLDRTIDVHIKSLRRKLGSAGDNIETVRGVGYRFADP